MTQFDEVYSKVCEMLCDAKDLELDDLDPDMPLHKLKLDSLDYVELMVLAKKEFAVTVGADLFIDRPNMTLRELCQYLSEKSH
ncbi:TPA: acyl carrier protein [Klebsiella michiganensis]|jgi:acyl carrier protein|uniref:Phosphopantetheine-binding protein n=1 Tax=Klebsiella michiganensis TaxID=1134687 RepID=A0A0J2H1G6_9ENTR|nr:MULTISPECIES: phosphopantetheine-binding protein [Klebsiella]AKL33421.1 acyl carrier protein [Klebsiella oxytoca]ARB23240.1 acyl carrier protein [Klebsiella oxytoca]AUW12247.1 acyl carrier protein [Klebsiella oxytoca]EKV5144613.1 acyl carrier protein [Klebsiella michiganensis]EKW0784925.1 acyl carrier protein [Klebsiella michiganensis]